MTGQRELIGGMALGVGLMYLLDPDRGTRRRALLRDRTVHTRRKVADGIAVTARDVRNRSQGAVASVRSRIRREQVGDEILEQRVRAELGRVVSHPGAINVTTHDGRVTLGGPVLADELDALLSRVRRVRGVDEVINELEVHETAGSVPALQGEGRPRGARPELLQENWSPTMRLAAGAVGALLAYQGARRRGLVGSALGAAGLGVLARAVANQPMRQLAGMRGRRSVDVRKTVNVAAPLEEVWALWSNFENLPRFMAHLKEVRVLGEGRSHWVAAGPAGTPVEWDAITTEWVPREVIAWKSVEGSMVGTAGRVQFRPGPADTTQIDIQMTYAPPAGVLGHAVAALFGADPKHAMDEDMVRLTSLLEEGRTSTDNGRVHREELEPAPGTTGNGAG